MMVTTPTRKFSSCQTKGWLRLSLKCFQLNSQSPSPQCQQHWALGSVCVMAVPFSLQIEGKMSTKHSSILRHNHIKKEINTYFTSRTCLRRKYSRALTLLSQLALLSHFLLDMNYLGEVPYLILLHIHSPSTLLGI